MHTTGTKLFWIVSIKVLKEMMSFLKEAAGEPGKKIERMYGLSTYFDQNNSTNNTI